MRRGIEVQFGNDIWDILTVDRVLPDLGIEGVVFHDVDGVEVPIEDAQRIMASWPEARLVETRGLGHRRIVAAPSVRTAVLEAIA